MLWESSYCHVPCGNRQQPNLLRGTPFPWDQSLMWENWSFWEVVLTIGSYQEA